MEMYHITCIRTTILYIYIPFLASACANRENFGKGKYSNNKAKIGFVVANNDKALLHQYMGMSDTVNK